MQHLWTLVLALVFAWSGEALANLPTQVGAPSLSSDSGAVKVARRKKKKRKKRKKRKRKKRGGGAVAPAEPPAPPPEPPPADTGGESGAETAGDGKEGGADWGSSDWASPDWAGGGSGGSSSSSSDLLKDDSDTGDGGSDKPVEDVEKKVEPSKPYRKSKGVGGAFLLVSPVYAGVNRSFKYAPAGNTSDNLRPYEAKYVSMVGANLEFYPGVLLEISAIDWLGVRGGYRMALGLKSAARTDPNTEYSTNWNEIDGELTGRFVFGDAMLTVGAGTY